uniref:Odorant binding protein 26 n=1 Tax=Colaphellus bowringi TaxID=561076 RepID=A0A0S3J2K6_9CUCU|nr:odorant binding protein 26 [Colaphellus bowringi]
MKAFVVLTFCLAVANAKVDPKVIEEIIEEFTETVAKCSDEINPNADDIAALTEMKHIPDSHEGKCMIYCIYRSFDAVEEDGHVKFEGGMAFLSKIKESDPDMFDKMSAIYKKCTETDYFDKDPCISSANFVSCNIKAGKEANISSDISSW